MTAKKILLLKVTAEVINKILRVRVLPHTKQNFQTENDFCCQHNLILMNVLTSVSTTNPHLGLLHIVNTSLSPPKS